MRRVEDRPNALRATTSPGVLETLQACNSQLEKIHKSLEVYVLMPFEYSLASNACVNSKIAQLKIADRYWCLVFVLFSEFINSVIRIFQDYLELKRLSFPRFYFLSNDELLDVLSQGRTPSAIQPHLGKCFANIRRLDIRLSPRNTDGPVTHQPPIVRSMISAEGEVMAMPK